MTDRLRVAAGYAKTRAPVSSVAVLGAMLTPVTLRLATLTLTLAMALAAAGSVHAGNSTPTTANAKPSASPVEIDLTPEEKAERDGRKSCKVAICAAFRARQTAGGDIACDITKSWRKEQLAKLVGKLKVTWPYAGVRCTSKVALKRADLIKAMTEPKFELTLDPHAVQCAVNRDKDAPTKIAFDFTPKVSFENGKATTAQMNWGKIDAPTVIKSGLWTATAADNTVNVLSGTLVDDINDFIGKKCDDVKAEWAQK